jgi:transposase
MPQEVAGIIEDTALSGIAAMSRGGLHLRRRLTGKPSCLDGHRRFQHWVRTGLLRTILEVLAQAPRDEGYLDLQEAFIDGSFAPATQGGACVGRRTRTQRTQDGRPLRRCQRRWKIERLFDWFQNFRRLVVRYERFAENFLGMLHLACCVILLRGL